MGSCVTARNDHGDTRESKLRAESAHEWVICSHSPKLAGRRTSIRLVFAAAMYACPVALSEEPHDRLNTVAVGGVGIERRASVHSHTHAASV